MNDTTGWCQNASVTEPQREDAPLADRGGARATVDCAIGMERVLFFRAALSFRHASRATSLSEGGSKVRVLLIRPPPGGGTSRLRIGEEPARLWIALS